MSHKKKRNIIIGVLCGVLLLMVVGYAAFSSVLNIKGTSNVSSNWNIKITSITSKTLSGNATNVKEPEGVGTLTASFETNLESPGDSIEYTITISNSGDINAKLDKITLSEPDNEYVTFETSGLTEGEPLNTGSTADLKVIVTFKDVEINKMDTSTSNLKVQLDFSQANGNSETPGPSGPYAAEILAEKVVTTGDGLYVDTYESEAAPVSEDTNANTRYVYKGANPDNYITFNNELWRILAVEKDGTLKIMKKDSIGNRAWDTNDATTGRNNANNTYCQKSSGTYYGCNAWGKIEGTFINGSKTGTVTQDASLNTYLNTEYYNSLSSETQNLIQNHTWGIGGVTHNNTDLAAQIQSENGTTWNGNIGLMSVSDYLRANTNTDQCGNLSLNNSNGNTCKTTNYIVQTSDYVWTISPYASNAGNVFFVISNGAVSGNFAGSSSDGVLPVLYLKSDITLSGSGTETDPYTITAG